MLGVHENDTPNVGEFDVFSDGARVRIFGKEPEHSSQLVTKEVRSLRAIAAPPMRFVPNLSGSGNRRLNAQSVRLVQFREEVVGIHKLASVRLSDGFEEQALLFGRDAECFAVVTQNGDLLAF